MSVDKSKKHILKYLIWKKKHVSSLSELIKTTCIIGLRCKDGILLAGDTRMTRGTKLSHQPKIIQPHQIPIVYASSGTTALMDNFLNRVNFLLYQVQNKSVKIDTLEEFKERLEDIVFEIYERYTERTPEHLLDVFVGYKTPDSLAGLYHIHSDGVSENVVDYDIIGSGEPYAMPFIQSIYYPDITLFDSTLIVCFVLSLIDELQLDYSVGGLPQIVWIIDVTGKKEPNIVQVPDDQILEILNSFRENEGKSLSYNLWNIFTRSQEK